MALTAEVIRDGTTNFNYKEHNQNVRDRWIQLRINKELEYVNRSVAPELTLPTIRILDRFIALSINRAKSDGEDISGDIKQLKQGLSIIDGI